MGWVPWLGAPPWPLEPEGTEKSVCGLAWPLAFPCPIGACGKVTSPAGSPSSGYLGTLGGGGPLEGCWAHRIGVLWCGTSKRRARMARAQETVKVSEWAGASHTTPLPALHSTSLGFRRRLQGGREGRPEKVGSTTSTGGSFSPVSSKQAVEVYLFLSRLLGGGGGGGALYTPFLLAVVYTPNSWWIGLVFRVEQKAP